MLRAPCYDCHLQRFCRMTWLKTHLEKSCSDYAEKQEEGLSTGDSAMALLLQQRAGLQRWMLPHTSSVLPSVGQGNGPPWDNVVLQGWGKVSRVFESNWGILSNLNVWQQTLYFISYESGKQDVCCSEKINPCLEMVGGVWSRWTCRSKLEV